MNILFDTKKELDAAVLEYIANGASHLSEIRTRLHREIHGDRLTGLWNEELERRLDKSLQRLRKAGKIVYMGQKLGWHVVEAIYRSEHQEP